MNLLKPSADEVEALALAETQPALAARFRPLALGFVLTILSLGLVGLVSLPWIVLRAMKRLFGKRQTGRAG